MHPSPLKLPSFQIFTFGVDENCLKNQLVAFEILRTSIDPVNSTPFIVGLDDILDFYLRNTIHILQVLDRNNDINGYFLLDSWIGNHFDPVFDHIFDCHHSDDYISFL